MTTTQTCEALTAVPQAVRKHLHKASSRPYSPHSHMGEHVRQALCCCHRFCSFPPLRLSLCLDGTARHRDQAFIMVPLMLSGQSLCRGVGQLILSPFSLKLPFPFVTFVPVSPDLCCEAPGRAPSLPPRRALWRIARGQCVRCSCRAKNNKKRRSKRRRRGKKC